MPKWRLHSSGLDMLARCGEQYRRRYIPPEEIIPPGVALITGSGTHKSVELNLTRVIEAGEFVPLEEAEQAARDYVSGEFERGCFWLSAEERKKKTADAWRDEAVDWAVRLSGLHYEAVAPSIRPVGVEQPWLIELDGFPCDLAGWIDIDEGDRGLRDTKTGAKKPSQAEVDGSTQLTLYALAKKVTAGKKPERLCIDALMKHHEKGKPKPEYLPLTTQRGDADFQALLRRIEVTVDAIEKGVFIPARPGADWWCSPKWCGYWDTCPYSRGRTVHSVGGSADGQ